MSLIRKLFLLAVFVLSTYAWLILFEFGPSGYKDGFLTYYTRFVPSEEEKEEIPLPQAPKKPKNAKPVVGGGGEKPQKP